MSEETNELKDHVGGCHCGAVRFEVTVDASGGMACNCSICSRAGWLLAFVPASAFRLTTAEAALQDYQFGKKSIHHTFCKTCGVRPFSWGTSPDGDRMYSVNLRCLDGLDVGAVAVQHFDGASL